MSCFHLKVFSLDIEFWFDKTFFFSALEKCAGFLLVSMVSNEKSVLIQMIALPIGNQSLLFQIAFQDFLHL